MPQPIPQIDPTKPVSGNFKGTFAGFVAIMGAGYVANQGLFDSVAAIFCNDADPMFSCQNIRLSLIIMFIAIIGSFVNYAVTHFSQVKNLKDLYESLPTTYAEFPNDKKPSGSIGAENGNYNKGIGNDRSTIS